MKYSKILIFLCLALFWSNGSLLSRSINERIDLNPQFDNGIAPIPIAIDPDKNRIYVGNTISNNISVIDSLVSQTTDTISVSFASGVDNLECPADAIAVNSASNRIYVVAGGCTSIDKEAQDSGFNSPVIVINSITNEIVETIFIDNLSKNNLDITVGLNSVTNRIYVTASNTNKVFVIDGLSNQVIESINNVVPDELIDNEHITRTGQKGRIAINSISNKIYFAFDKVVTVIDGSTNEIDDFIQLNKNLSDIECNPETRRIYVAMEDSVAVINGLGNKVVKVVDLGETVTDIAVNSVTNLIYALSVNFLNIIDGATNNIINTAEIAGDAIEVDSARNTVYIVETDKNSVSVIDGSNNDILSTIILAVRPHGIDININTKRIYATTADSNSLFIVDGITNEIVKNVDVGDKPFDIAVNSTTNRIYVANIKSNDVSVIDGAVDEVIDTVNIAESPKRIAINQVTNLIYVVSDESITVIAGDNNDITNTIKVKASAITIDSKSNLIYVMSKEGIHVIDGFDNEIVEKVDIVGDEIIINPLTNLIYVTSNDNGEVIVIDVLKKKIVEKIMLRIKPDDLENGPDDRINIGGFALNSANNHIYLTHDSTVGQRSNPNPFLERFVTIISGIDNEVICLIKLGDVIDSITGNVTVDPDGENVYLTVSNSGEIVIVSDPEIKFLNVSPDSVRKSLSRNDATVTALDSNGKPVPNVTVNAIPGGLGAVVEPLSMDTNSDGEAIFQFRFRHLSTDSEIIFKAEELETKITRIE